MFIKRRVRNLIARKKEMLARMELTAKVKEDLKTVALGTSKINYLDPRITIAWCKLHEVRAGGRTSPAPSAAAAYSAGAAALAALEEHLDRRYHPPRNTREPVFHGSGVACGKLTAGKVGACAVCGCMCLAMTQVLPRQAYRLASSHLFLMQRVCLHPAGAHREDLQQEPAEQVPLEHGVRAGLPVLTG
jgi:hypothetical protein